MTIGTAYTVTQIVFVILFVLVGLGFSYLFWKRLFQGSLISAGAFGTLMLMFFYIASCFYNAPFPGP